MAGLTLRHKRLADKIGRLNVLLFNGTYQSRNYADNTYPFRPQSNFVYVAGICPPGSYFLLHEGRAYLFIPEYTVDDLIWSGEAPSLELLAESSGCEVHYVDELSAFLAEIPRDNLASLPVSAPGQDLFLERYLGRVPSLDNENDRLLAEAVISLRLCHDEEAYRELKSACQATVEAHLEGLRALVRGAESEGDIYASMLFKANAKGYGVSFNPIITTKGERLHQVKLGATLQKDGLLLVDFGLENNHCWAGDITNTWPVGGTYNAEQKAIYNTVLQAHKECVAMLKPGVDWVEVHRKALEVIASGLHEVGVLVNGDVDTYLDSNVVSIFMPHGIGHLLG
ncbi:aminopeptidase P N-terminal domain-containing protein, partial [bacterium]|nr:aminopeptidase P N-terminal domain-containing protein [bacterium]